MNIPRESLKDTVQVERLAIGAKSLTIPLAMAAVYGRVVEMLLGLLPIFKTQDSFFIRHPAFHILVLRVGDLV